jgi:hypothetical protein
MVQFRVAASSAAPRLSLPKAWGWQISKTGARLQRVCEYVLAGDLSDDCQVDFDEFARMAANWLIDCHTEPPNQACIPK